MGRNLDLDTWKRRRHYELFKTYDLPFFNVTAELDVTELLRRCRRDDGPSFFVATLYLVARAVNGIEELRYRIRGEEVHVVDQLDVGSTVLLEDETFTFAYFDYQPEFADFAVGVEEVLAAIRSSQAPLEPADHRDDLIHLSVLPWVSFTSVSHARRLGANDSVPKISIGRRAEVAGRQKMPVSIEAHHALVDGLHVGRFFQDLQGLLDDPPISEPELA